MGDQSIEMYVSGLSFQPSNFITVPLGGRGSAAFSDISNGLSIETIDANAEVYRSPVFAVYCLNGVLGVSLANIGDDTTGPDSLDIHSMATAILGQSYYDSWEITSDGFEVILYDDSTDYNYFTGWWYYICWA